MKRWNPEKDWRGSYESRIISAERAAEFVQSGQKVEFTLGREGYAIGLAIAARVGEVKGVQIVAPSPGYDFGWYDSGFKDSFEVSVLAPTATCQEALDKGICNYLPGGLLPFTPLEEGKRPDIVITEISPPNENGFCSFGQSLWNKKSHIRRGILVIAEVNKNLIRTYGDNFVHVSEIDYFVEHTSSGAGPASGSLAGRALKEPESFHKQIANNVAELIKDGDTIQIGVGRVTEHLVRLGMLDDKHDIGYHSEATAPGIIPLVKKGIITGDRKTVNPGKVVVTSLGGGTKEEMEWTNNNPLFHLVDVKYLEDPRVIGAHDNMVAINNALAVDLAGQITAESIGSRLIAGSGGQVPFVIGAWLSKGGRSITILSSTALGGTVSRIVPTLPEGTIVTIHHTLADYIVTEYGIARLANKTVSERARELIRIAHPDFREELRAKAKKLM